jgi:hypothetical protein
VRVGSFLLFFSLFLGVGHSSDASCIGDYWRKLFPSHSERGSLEARVRKPRLNYVKGEGGIESWTIDGVEGAADYAKSFKGLIQLTGEEPSPEYFDEYLRSRKQAGKTANVLDLFGSGFFVHDQTAATSITGLRFGPLDRSRLPKDFTLSRIPPEVLGDIINPETWTKLDQSMKSRGISKMDLIVMRPIGGWQSAPFSERVKSNARAIDYIVRNSLDRLSSEGRFYFSVSIPQLSGKMIEHPIFKKLIRDIEKTSSHRLVLIPTLSTINTTYEISGALLPK